MSVHQTNTVQNTEQATSITQNTEHASEKTNCQKNTNVRKQQKAITLIVLVIDQNKMNCELMLTYDTPALRQTGRRNMTGQITLPTIWGTYMKLVTKYQISAINSC
jgi:hypothetical protein